MRLAARLRPDPLRELTALPRTPGIRERDVKKGDGTGGRGGKKSGRERRWKFEIEYPNAKSCV